MKAPRVRTFDNSGVAALLALTTVATVLGIDGVLPGMPALAAAFGVDRAAAQLTLSMFLIGIAVGQLVHGPLSDRFGRKPALIAGLLLNVAATVGSAMAPSIEALAVFRFIHGIAAATGWIVSRAVVRDLFERREAARVMSVALFFHGLAPLIAPIVGAHLTVRFGWNASFIFITVYTSAVALVFLFMFRETIAARDPGALRMGPMLRNFREVARSVPFWGYAACAAAAYGILFSFLGSSAYVIITFFGESETDYSYMFAACMLGNMLCMLAGARLVGRFGVDGLLRLGVFIGTFFGLVLAALAWAEVHHWLAVIGPMAFAMTSFAFIFPQSVAGALQPFPQIAGAASSLMGFVQQVVGAVSGVVVAALSDGDQFWLAHGVLFWAVFGLAAYWLLVRRHRTI